MKVTPVASPGQIPSNAAPSTPDHVRVARAVAAFNNGVSSHEQPATQVVQNQNQISAEELGAIKSKSLQQVTEEPRQTTTDVETSPAIPEPNIDDTKAAQPEDPALSRQFAQLARQERTIRAKQQQAEQAIKTREAALAEREAALAAKDQEYKSGYIPKTQLKNNPLQALLEAEVSYDELTQQILNQSNPLDPRIENHISKLEAKIQSLEKSAEEAQNTYKSSQQQQFDNAVKQLKTDAKALVANDPNFETIKATNSVDEVVDLIVRTYKEDGILMSVADAAEEVENHILEEAVKLSKLSKVQKRGQSVVPQSTPKTQETENTQAKVQSAPTMKTLTNAAASTRPLTARERALLAFKGEKF